MQRATHMLQISAQRSWLKAMASTWGGDNQLQGVVTMGKSIALGSCTDGVIAAGEGSPRANEQGTSVHANNEEDVRAKKWACEDICAI